MQTGTIFLFSLLLFFNSNVTWGYSIDVSLPTDTVTTTTIQGGAVTGEKIYHMGASNGDTMIYDSSSASWTAGPLDFSSDTLMMAQVQLYNTSDVDTGHTCSSASLGTQRYNETYAVMQFCDGTYWREVGNKYWFSSEDCIVAGAAYGVDEMVSVGSYCVDKYEASIWGGPGATSGQYYTNGVDQNTYTASDNIAAFKRDGSGTSDAYAISKADVIPAAGVTWYQASAACANSGKELTPDHIWQLAVIGTVDATSAHTDIESAGGTGASKTICNTYDYASGTWQQGDSNVRYTNRAGSTSAGSDSCISKFGVHDMIGNLAEWTAMHGAARATGGTGNGPFDLDVIPSATIVASYRCADLDTCTSGTSLNTGGAVAAGVRGGDYESGTFAGAFSLSMLESGSSSYYSIGFRCARSK